MRESHVWQRQRVRTLLGKLRSLLNITHRKLNKHLKTSLILYLTNHRLRLLKLLPNKGRHKSLIKFFKAILCLLNLHRRFAHRSTSLKLLLKLSPKLEQGLEIVDSLLHCHITGAKDGKEGQSYGKKLKWNSLLNVDLQRKQNGQQMGNLSKQLLSYQCPSPYQHRCRWNERT